MDFELSDEERMLSETVERVAQEASGAEGPIMERLAGPGLLGAPLPETAGGFDLGMCGAVILLEALARHGITSPLLGSVILGAMTLAEAGCTEDEPHVAATLAGRAAIGAEAPAPGGTRLTGGATGEVAAPRGRLAPVLADGDARLWLVFLHHEGAAALFIREEGRGDVFHPWQSGDGRPLGALDLAGGQWRRLGGDREKSAILAARAQARFHCGLAAEATGAMQALFDLTGQHLETRRQFGRPLGTFQALQHRFAELYVGLDAARSLMLAAAMALDADAPEAPVLARKAWVQAALSGRTMLEEAIQMHGAIGMTEEAQTTPHIRRLATAEALAGTPGQHLSQLARP